MTDQDQDRPAPDLDASWADEARREVILDVARRWLGRLLLAHLAIVLAVGAVSGLQLYRIGTFQPLPLDRVAAFDRLTRAMEIAYPYFELKAVDWDALVARYRPQVEAAQSDSAYASAVERMLAELNDAHTGVMPSPVKNGGCFFAATREMEGHAVVVQVGGSAQEVGLTVGSVILTVDGRSLEQALDAVDPRLTYGSTPRQRRARAFQFMLKTPLGGYTRGARGWIGLHPEPKTDVLPLDS